MYALGRNKEKAKVCFAKYSENPNLIFIPYDENLPLTRKDIGTMDYVLRHAYLLHNINCYSSDSRTTRPGSNNKYRPGQKRLAKNSHASNTHPMQYATDPVVMITTNIFSLHNLLDFAVTHNVTRFASSNEIYDENRGGAEFFDAVW